MLAVGCVIVAVGLVLFGFILGAMVVLWNVEDTK